ncbi:MAG: DUF1801 domain-containing protein [Gemmatimonadaceae bacterium]
MQSKAKTVSAYLAELPPDRRGAVEAVRKVVLEHMDPALEEGMQYGMIGWYVPHKVFSPGYHCDPRQPLPYACLASQKHHLSLYLMSVYADGTRNEQWFRKAWAKTGKKLDMGKCCIRFKRAEDLALDVIGEAFDRSSVKDHLAHYAQYDPRNRKASPARKASARKAPARKASANTASSKRGAAARITAK